MSRIVPKRKAKDVAQYFIEHLDLDVKNIVSLPPEQVDAETDDDDIVEEEVGEAVVTCDIAGTFEIEVEDQYEAIDIEKKAVGKDILCKPHH